LDTSLENYDRAQAQFGLALNTYLLMSLSPINTEWDLNDRELAALMVRVTSQNVLIAEALVMENLERQR
jgi:hypothetical protein